MSIQFKTLVFSFLVFLHLSIFPKAALSNDMWTQQPDWTLGYDIQSITPTSSHDGIGIADDFMTDNIGNPITNITWWGSYQNDTNQAIPIGALSPATNIEIVFMTDVPQDDPDNQFGFSHPGLVLKYYDLFGIQGVKDGYQQWSGHNGYLYSVDTSNDPLILQPNTVYWISILAVDISDNTGNIEEFWGWKTSDTNWNDDAISGLIPMGTTRPNVGESALGISTNVQELVYPLSHPNDGQGVDMAFNIAVVPEPISSTLFIVGGAILGLRRFRKKFKK